MFDIDKIFSEDPFPSDKKEVDQFGDRKISSKQLQWLCKTIDRKGRHWERTLKAKYGALENIPMGDFKKVMDQVSPGLLDWVESKKNTPKE